MSGSSSPVMTITGSGNQGIFLGVPYRELYRKHGNKILPAVVFSLLTQIHLTKQRKRISDKCGLATKAAPALAAGLAFAKGEDLTNIRQVMREVEQRLQDMRCYGARASCGNKAARACCQVRQSLQTNSSSVGKELSSHQRTSRGGQKHRETTRFSRRPRLLNLIGRLKIHPGKTSRLQLLADPLPVESVVFNATSVLMK